MELVSTRNSTKKVSFRNAVLDCIPPDGGLYVPANEADLRPWILYMDETTSFPSVAGTLTSALLKEEFSPVVCERIAGSAFGAYAPQIRQLDDFLYSLELYHGPTGCHKDFGFMWFSSALEHILTMEDRTAVVLAATGGMTGRSLASAFAGKKRLKMILVFAKGALTGIDPSLLAWNGGNIWPVEIDGSLEDAQKLVRDVYSNRTLVTQYGLTLANTMNIGRLLPQVFFYMFAFSRLRKKVRGEIFYGVPSGNYGNLVAGLYAWKFSLPVNGFITDATHLLSCDISGRCQCNGSAIPLESRNFADPARPSNIERLEQVFEVNPAMLRGLVFPVTVSSADVPSLIEEACSKYGITLDTPAALAYGAVKQTRDRIDSDEGTVVLVSKDHPAFESSVSASQCDASLDMRERLALAAVPVKGAVRLSPDSAGIVKILREFTGK
ncbi:MAG TPA: pyridoxal-phosphate dependent enzyme [Treponemataceae bacterium]|nr:pyridoxal-phosphate dependent enzyme [Treponemataceae bacterium]HQL32338.1 pyridoxal-phosphate dependent enzyme [Treponemataceae bacterium]